MNVSLGISAAPFVLADASGSALILGSVACDFTCIKNASLALVATVDSAWVSGGNIFPKYGVFIRATMPLAASLFLSILPDVQITTVLENPDTSFHTFTGANTIVNPTAPMIIVFAVGPDSSGTAGLTPTNYQYKNFAVSGPGDPCGTVSGSMVYDGVAASQFAASFRLPPRSNPVK
jgi:hypothetical protein